MREILSRLRAALTPYWTGLIVVLTLVWLMAAMQEGDSLEERISRTLSGMDGAGRVEVIIRMREVNTSEGMLGAQKTQSVPCGAVAVAQGADDPMVALALHEALCALLGLPPSSVSVMTGGK